MKIITKSLVIISLMGLFTNAEATTFTWEHINGFNCGPTYGWASAEPATIAWEDITGFNSSPPYGWAYSYDIGFYSGTLMIDVDVYLTGYDPGVGLKNRWEYGIESLWSTTRFSIPISFNVDWVTTDYDYAVRIVNGAGRWNMLTWYTVGAGGWGDAYQEEVAAHEYGHMISLWDEYAGGAVNPSTHLINTGGLMHVLNGPTLDYYYDPFLSWYQEKLTLVPEPSTMLLLCVGLTGITAFRRRYKY